MQASTWKQKLTGVKLIKDKPTGDENNLAEKTLNMEQISGLQLTGRAAVPKQMSHCPILNLFKSSYNLKPNAKKKKEKKKELEWICLNVGELYLQ